MRANARDLAVEEHYPEAITKLEECIASLHPDEQITAEIKNDIANISEQRLVANIKAVSEKTTVTEAAVRADQAGDRRTGARAGWRGRQAGDGRGGAGAGAFAPGACRCG